MYLMMMKNKDPLLSISLLGRFSVRFNGQCISGFDANKVQEILAYLLLHKAPQPRESLANVIWGEYPPTRARKYLRQAIWQIQQSIESQLGSNALKVVSVDTEWISIPLDADLWLDVDVFEQAFVSVQGVAGSKMSEEQAKALQTAVELYHGDLLCNCYQDWCLMDRERLQNHRLVILDKLMEYHEHQGHYEMGIVYGEEILASDCARERTHRQLMKLRYLAGDRSAAIRQYQKCLSTLSEELGVRPSARTQALYNRICSDQPSQFSAEQESLNLSASQSASVLPSDAPYDFQAHAIHCLKSLYAELSQFQNKLQKSIEQIEERRNK